MEGAKNISKETTQSILDRYYDSWFVKSLEDFVKVPNLSLAYDPEYATNGLREQAIEQVHKALEQLQIKGLKRDIIQPAGSNPLIIYTVEPTDEGKHQNVMLYGHLDKQPWFDGWEEGLHPIKPVIRGDYMYGRGASDDGYAAFGAFLAVKICQEQGVRLPRICMTLETEEESGSPNLVSLLEAGSHIIGTPDIMLCLDSGCLDYEQLWLTSSLRGIVVMDLEVQFANVGYHSGETGGILPETFRIVRELLDRIDDSKTGKVTELLHVEPPQYKAEEAKQIAEKYGPALYNKYNYVAGGKVIAQDDLATLYLNNCWNPTLAITGAEGLPAIATAGNVIRPKTSVRLSCRMCPAMDAKKGEEILTKLLTENVPYGAKVTLKGGHSGSGWAMKELKPWFMEEINKAGQAFFDKDVGSYGEGGSIPFLNELGKKFPETQIVAFGLLGPQSNAHGPNESINLKYCKSLIGAMAHVIAGIGQQK